MTSTTIGAGESELLVLGGPQGRSGADGAAREFAEFAEFVARRCTSDVVASDVDLPLWRELLGLPAVRGALDPDGDPPEQLPALAALAVVLGGAPAPLPLVDAAVTVRALTRTGHPAALDAAWHIRAGDQLGALARVGLGGSTVLVPVPSGYALLRRAGGLALLARDGDTAPGLPALTPSPPHAWHGAGGIELLTGPGADDAQATAVNEWRILTTCLMVGAMEATLTLATEYAKCRVQFDAPIGSFQAVAHRLATAAVLTEGLRTLADEILAGGSGRPDVLAAYLHAAEVAPRVAEICVHVHGGQGVTEAAPSARYLRRVKALAVAGGSRPALLRELIETGETARPAAPDLPEARSIRARARTFFQHLHTTRPDADAAVLLSAMARAGLLGMTWTGQDLRFDHTPAEHLAVAEEAMDAGFELTALTTTMNVAKTMAVVATVEQRRAVLPDVAAGQAIICLGYSEAEAGSDVASVRTTALRDGDGWRIDGAKLYTSRAHLARYVFLLARTDPDLPKWRGLTTFLVPIDTPGLRVEPLPMLSGTFTTATYYDAVRVPDSARIGDVDAGGSVLQIALQFEHGGGSVPGRTLAGPGRTLLAAVLAVAAEERDERGRPVLDDPMVAACLAAHRTQNAISVALERRSIRRAGATGTTGPLASIVKLQAREAYQRLCADVLDLFGERATLGRGAPGNLADGLFERCYRAAQAVTIHGGTSEIQRTIIAERWLELPRAGRR